MKNRRPEQYEAGAKAGGVETVWAAAPQNCEEPLGRRQGGAGARGARGRGGSGVARLGRRSRRA